MTSTAVMTEAQERFLRQHRLAVLATGRRDGSPQVSTIYYDYDGADIVISVTSDRWKWKNAIRQPKVALLVNEGRQQLILYGTAEGISDDPERLELTKRLRRRAGTEFPDDATFAAELDGAHRTILRITPQRVAFNE